MKKMAWLPSILLTLSPEKAEALNPAVHVEEARIRKDVKFLTSTSLPRHYKNRGALKETTDYIKKVFEDCAEYNEVQKFQITGGTNYENIIASFGPRDGERFIIGAHYDVYGHYPGADDNASGVSALLEIARLLKKQKPKLNHRIDLVAYALEEPPFFGSEAFIPRKHGLK